jgi:alpha-L-fucosidase
MIINNTGLNELGRVGHYEIDSVTFERGKPCFVDNFDKPRAGEMCQVLNDHWGYAENDCNYKSVKELIENLVDCRKYNCNFLLNTGLLGDGSVNLMDRCLLEQIGKWVRSTKGFIYNAKVSDVKADNTDVFFDGENYYAVIKDVEMTADENVQRNLKKRNVKIHADVYDAKWLDNGQPVDDNNGEIFVEPYHYGASYSIRVLKFKIKERNSWQKVD